MAKRLPPRIQTGPKKGQFRKRAGGTKRRKKSTARRKTTATARKKTYRRRRPRRRNPSVDGKGLALAVVGGGVVGAGNYVLDGVEKVTNKQQAMIVGGGGLLLGLIASFASKPLGQGIAAGAIALGGYKLATILIEENKGTEQQLTGVYDPYGRYLGTPQQVAQLNAVQADLGAIEANLGRMPYGTTEVELAAIEAQLG